MIEQFSDDELMRAAFWAPCVDKDHLHRWVKTYLGIDLPRGIVCDDEIHADPSNSSPLDLLWEMYWRAMYEPSWDNQRFLAYSAREAYKTLICSIAEVVSLFHWKRSVAHAAAIEQQALKCAQYVDRHLERPILRDFVVGNNKRMLEVGWYESKDGKIKLPFKKYKDMVRAGGIKELDYERKMYYLHILVATLSSMNSEHVPFLCLDEIDIMAERPYKEAQAIPSPTEDGRPPIVFLTSTRKFTNSIVQNEIDNAAESGLQIRHWNIIDVAKPCPPARHLPEEPKIQIYYSTESLKIVPEADFKILSPEEQAQYHAAEGYVGCLKNCTIFAGCRGRLATRAPSISKSSMLKDVAQVITSFKTYAGDPNFVKAQYLAWKAENVGSIFPFLSAPQHLITAAAMAERLTGEPYKSDFSKSDLIALFRSLGAKFVAGMDHGYTHNYAVVLGAIWGSTLYIFHVIAVAGFELGQKIELCKRDILPFNPDIYPDTAYPGDNASYRRAGLRIRDKFKKDTHLSISAIRAKILPAPGAQPELFFLAGDSGCELLFERTCGYRWKLDAAGKPTDQPHDKDDDEVDALRYLVQNEFGHKLYKRNAVTNTPAQVLEPASREVQVASINKQLFANEVQSLTDDVAAATAGTSVRKGRFFFSG